MRSRKFVPVIAAALLLAGLPLAGAPVPAAAADSFSFAVIGDVPYGSAQIAAFPRQIDQINADPTVQLASHLGDISSPLNCTDSYYSAIKTQFDRFVDPFVYTPGDNEWADCHRATVGKANPLDRLSAVRRTFFPAPGTTLGMNRIGVSAQSGYPENVLFDAGGMTIAAVHIVGSNNDLNTWTGLGYSSPTTAQKAEVTARTNAGNTLMRDAFAQARANGSRAVVLITQADMFAPGADGSTYRTAFQSLVKTIAAESLSFAKPVFLVNGDTHNWASDKPLMSSTWRSYYGVASAVPNLSRITVKGGTSEWTKFTVVADAAVLKVQRIPFGAVASNAAPVAAFTSSANALTATVNGSGSTDADGTIASYAWTFGDGATATGVTASHTYAAAGTYQVTLTVTDNAGATGTVGHALTVSEVTPPPPPPPPAGSTLAQDSFTRTVSNGLGSAEIGGAWTTSGTAANFAVDGGAAAVTSPAGSNRFAYLDGVSSSDTELSATVSFTRPTASSIYAGLIGRRVGAATYGARVVVDANGSVKLQLQRSTNTVLLSTTVPGLTYLSGDRLQLRVQVTGLSPTTIRATVWKVGTTEPVAWQLTATDSTAALQSAGGIGLYNYLSGSASPSTLVVSFDDLRAGPTG
ncbi:PKD domain-containing protein [Cryobacterium sp. TMT1-2-1]|uniref:PKD domain-containing protein n=1 Tax=Cryobacterium sp. TMT1-2-1 TaxID=1259232 RepID=UPI00141B00BA|nr:PKD domain-containing protein [Cryobacterium sp. TMT1-2-1]